jgi:hypothetical protein
MVNGVFALRDKRNNLISKLKQAESPLCALNLML